MNRTFSSLALGLAAMAVLVTSILGCKSRTQAAEPVEEARMLGVTIDRASVSRADDRPARVDEFPPQLVTPADPSHLVLIEPWGQDLDGDGLATTKEGEFDVDGDGQFGELERVELGLQYYIHWMDRREYERLEAQGYAILGRVCASACTSTGGGPFICTSNLASVNCIDSGSGCSTVPCKFPCVCPP